MDRSLDEILAERQTRNGSSRGGTRGPRGGNGTGNGSGNRRRERERDYPRDGVRKSYRDEQPRNLDSEWVHDKFDDNDSRRGRLSRRRRDSPEEQEGPSGTKIRVDNIHYELTEEDLEGLFSRIGPLVSLKLLYDRSGRSEGTAYVTYETYQDASRAVREYDRANAAGQPIRLSILPSGPAGGAGSSNSNRAAAAGRNPFDTAVKPPRPLAERVTLPPGRRTSRSQSPPGGRSDGDGGEASLAAAARRGIDRYVPGRGSRSRSPYTGSSGGPRQQRGAGGGGRRPGARREREQQQQQRGGGGGGDEGARHGRDSRPRKTQEELDAEMEDYFGSGGGGGGASAGAAAPANGAGAFGGGNALVADPVMDDIHMIT